MATSQELLVANIKPCAIFKELLSLSIEDAIVRYNEWKGKDKKVKKIDWEGTVWQWLCTNPCVNTLCSIEGSHNISSNSEKKRWLENGSVIINGKRPKPFDSMDKELWELVFFSNERTITMI